MTYEVWRPLPLGGGLERVGRHRRRWVARVHAWVVGGLVRKRS